MLIANKESSTRRSAIDHGLGRETNQLARSCGTPTKLGNVAVPTILLCVFLAGCASNTLSPSTTLTSGANLATVGQAASAQMEQNSTLSGNSILALRKAVAFNDGYNGMVGNANSDTFVAHLSSIQGKIAQYGKMLESLSSSYSALGDLASYDASGTFDTSITELATNASAFASDIGKPITIPSDVSSGVKGLGGLAIDMAQASKVKDGSQKIEAILRHIIMTLDDSATKSQLIQIQTEVVGPIDQAATVLYNNGMCSYSPLLDDLGSSLNLRSLPTADDLLRKSSNDKVLAGLRNVEVEIAQQQISAQAASYDKSLDALKALVPLHESLQNGAPLNLKSIIGITAELQSLAITIQPAKKK